MHLMCNSEVCMLFIIVISFPTFTKVVISLHRNIDDINVPQHF